MSADTGAAALTTRLDRIKKLTDALVKTQGDSADARELADRIKREVHAARQALKPHHR